MSCHHPSHVAVTISPIIPWFSLSKSPLKSKGGKSYWRWLPWLPWLWEVRFFIHASPGIRSSKKVVFHPDGFSDRGAGPFHHIPATQLRLQDVNIRWSRKECTKSLARWPGLNFRCFFSGIKNDRWQTSSKSSKHLEAKNAVRRGPKEPICEEWWVIWLVVSTNPFEKYATVKIGSSSPGIRVENSKKCLKLNHHPRGHYRSAYVIILIQSPLKPTPGEPEIPTVPTGPRGLHFDIETVFGNL